MALGQTRAPPGPAPGGAPGRLHDFVHAAVLSPGPYALGLAGGLVDQVTDFPEEWEGGEGFGQRALARVGGGFVSDAVGHSTGALLGHRVLYEPCSRDGVWRRTRHALSRGFVTRTDRGGLAPNVSLFVAKFTTAGVANAWYPSSYTGRDAVRDGFVGIGVSAALNVAREFGPELMRMIGLSSPPGP